MISDDRTETITDRAAIRDSDEADPWRITRAHVGNTTCGCGCAELPTPVPASGVAVAAPCEHSWAWVSPAGASGSARLCQSCHQPDASWLNEITDAEDALARVTREADALRAKVAAVEAKRDEFADLLARALPAVAVLARVEALGDEWEAMTADVRGTRPEHWRGLDYAEGREAAFEDCAGWLRAALATGEGK